MARAPTKRSGTTATSTSAISRRPLTATSSRLLATKATRPGPAPVTASPTARPVMVGSRCLGEGVVGAGRDAGDRHVAAVGDHRAMGAVAAQHDDGRDILLRIMRAAAALSAPVPVTAMSRKRSSGNSRLAGSPRGRGRGAHVLRMPPFSGIITTLPTPAPPRQARTRSTILARSVICRLSALAMTRRMSRAETGLAMMPTIRARHVAPSGSCCHPNSSTRRAELGSVKLYMTAPRLAD